MGKLGGKIGKAKNVNKFSTKYRFTSFASTAKLLARTTLPACHFILIIILHNVSQLTNFKPVDPKYILYSRQQS